MCHHIVELHLHCSHITIRPSYCSSNPQLKDILINAGTGNEAAIHPRYQTSSHQSVSLIERCPNSTHPESHSFLLCCPNCRNRFEHAKYEVVHGDRRERVHHVKRVCSRSDTKASTLPTCARLNMQVDGSAQNQPFAASHEQAAFAFPYGLGFNGNLHSDLHDQSHPESDLATQVAKPEPDFELVEIYLRFPLTKCHHLIPFNMPETFLDEASDSILPCGCWTGKAPDTQMKEATLFVEYGGAVKTFKNVWDVTGLGPGGCWECGDLEVEVSKGGEDERSVVESGHRLGHTGWDHSATGGRQGINKETDELMNIQETFLEDCEQWRKMEDWKDKCWNGDLTERGAKLMAESRWAGTED